MWHIFIGFFSFRSFLCCCSLHPLLPSWLNSCMLRCSFIHVDSPRFICCAPSHCFMHPFLWNQFGVFWSSRLCVLLLTCHHHSGGLYLPLCLSLFFLCSFFLALSFSFSLPQPWHDIHNHELIWEAYTLTDSNICKEGEMVLGGGKGVKKTYSFLFDGVESTTVEPDPTGTSINQKIWTLLVFFLFVKLITKPPLKVHSPQCEPL